MTQLAATSESSQVVITINGGSSSIKFAAFARGGGMPQLFSGQIERIGETGTRLVATRDGGAKDERAIDAADQEVAAARLVAYLRERLGDVRRIAGIGHRVVHGGVSLLTHQLVTPAVIAELRRTRPLDLSHLPREIALIEALSTAFPGVPQVACFDTAFHAAMPRVAQLLPIPRSYNAAGIRRFGFHGLSYTYLLARLEELAGRDVANGRVILAHLGSGASMAAVRGGRPIDTTMAFTPIAGLVMGTRPGDLDPGLLTYLMRAEKKSPKQMDDFLTRQCGMLGVSETSSDMRDLQGRRATDVRAAEAIDLFCYQARKFIGALAAAMGGLDTLVFSGGIGEHSAEARAGICQDLDFLGITLDPAANAANAVVISVGRVGVRVIPTDEESVIARTTFDLLPNTDLKRNST